MRHYAKLIVLAFVALPMAAFAQNYKPSNGLVFGGGTVMTGPTKPFSGQAVCNVNGVLVGCGSSGGGGGGGMCSGQVTLSNGTALIANSCIGANTACILQDITTLTNPVTLGKVVNGGGIITGVGGDLINWRC